MGVCQLSTERPRLLASDKPWQRIDLDAGVFDVQKYLTWILLHAVDTGGESVSEYIKQRIEEDVKQRPRMPIVQAQPITVEEPLSADGHLKALVVVRASYEAPALPEVRPDCPRALQRRSMPHAPSAA